ncbi:ATP-dependent zinc protease [Candidatus Saccharibacteria bacterium]|nr:ATP-dependent zinc protease [Candidatus Saccharibacteria bacterium]
MENSKKQRELKVIGNAVHVSIEGCDDIPAKIDTGADSSSVWASNIEIKEDGHLYFTLFDKKSPFYTGKVLKRKDFSVLVVRSSNGTEQIRYFTKLLIKIKGRKIRASVTLTNRSNNSFPVLIGRRTLAGKFLVDTSKTNILRPPKNVKSGPLNDELKKDPHKFHQKYFKKS